MRKLIRSQLALRDKTQKDLAIWVGLTERRVSFKMNHPEYWTYGELTKIAKKMKIDVKELIP